MAAPIIPSLLRLLFSTNSKSTQSLVTKIWNTSGKTISQKRLWELSRSLSGVRQLEEIYKNVQNAPTLTKVREKLTKTGVKKLTYEDALSADIDSIEMRVFLSSKVLERLATAGKSQSKVKPFLVKLANNILSGTYSTSGFTFDEIYDYIVNSDLTGMIETFKTEALYYN